MPAQTNYLTSIISYFSTFLNTKGCSFDEQQEAVVDLMKLLEYKKDFSHWSSQELEKFYTEKNISFQNQALLREFVSSYPPYQVNVFLHDYTLALAKDGCSPATIKNYRSDIDQFIYFSNDKEITRLLSKPKVLDFLKYEQNKGLRYASIYRKLVSITQFAFWAENLGLIQDTTQALQKLKLNLSTELSSRTNPNENQNNLLSVLKHGFISPTVSSSKATNPLLDSPTIQTINNSTTRTQNQGLETRTKTLSLKPPIDLSPQGARANQEHRVVLQEHLDRLNQKITAATPKFLIPYLNSALLIILLVGVGYFGYIQLFRDTPEPFAYPATPTRPTRSLSFQGRLTDTAENPITTPTDMEFRLFDDPSGGTELWDSGTCSITPDQDGIFSTGLGDSGLLSDCGPEIGEDVFSENASVYLEVTIESETLDPRQPIKAVAYALNSETLQGYPIDATGAATVSTVVTMDQYGQVVLGETSPKLKSVSGTFTIEAQAFVLQTEAGSNGDISLSPDGTGVINLNANTIVDGSLTPATTDEDLGSVTERWDLYANTINADSTVTLTGLGTGTDNTVLILDASNNVTTDEINPKVWDTGVTIIDGTGTANRVTYWTDTDTVAADDDFFFDGTNVGVGTTTVSGYRLNVNGDVNLSSGFDYYVNGIGLNDNASGSSGASLIGLFDDAMTYISGNTQVQDAIKQLDTAIGTVSGNNYWQRIAGNLSPNNLNDTLSATTSAATALTITQTGAFDALLIQDEAGDTSPFVIDQIGNVGIGSATPAHKLDVTTTNASGRGINVNSTISSGTTDVYGVYSLATAGSSGATGIGAGSYSQFTYSGSGAVSNASAGRFNALITGSAPSVANINGIQILATSNVTASSVRGIFLNTWGKSGAGTLTNAVGISINDLTNGGTITNTYGAYIGDITTGTQTNTPFSFYASDANAFNYFAGNVGIGDTSPTYNLDVNGTGRFTGAVDLDGDLELNSTLTDINGAVGSAGQVLSSTGSGVDWIDAVVDTDDQTLAEVLIEGNVTGGTNMVFSTTDELRFYGDDTDSRIYSPSDDLLNIESGSLAIATDVWDITAAGAATGFTQLTVDNLTLDGNTLSSGSGAVTIQPLAGQNLNIALSTTGDFVLNTDQIYADTSTTNVGIGSTVPAYKLDVNGDIRAASGSDYYLGTIGFNDNSSGSSGASLIGLYDDSMAYISGNTHVQDAIKQLDTAIGTVSGSTYWQRITGNLSPLNLNDTIAATTSAATALTITQTGAFDALLVQDSADDTSPFVINQSGNVGIGTTNPTEALFIQNGNIRLSNSFNNWIGNSGSQNIMFNPSDITTNSQFIFTGGIGSGTSGSRKVTEFAGSMEVATGTSSLSERVANLFHSTVGSDGTAPLVALVGLDAVQGTFGGTVDTSATLYIADAFTGATDNYSLWVDSGATRLDGTLNLSGIGTGTDNTVLILDSSNNVTTDEIDPRVWGTTIVDGTGTANRVAYWTDADTIAADDDFFFNGTNVGVGTTTVSSYRLNVNGDVNLSSGFDYYINGIGFNDNSSGSSGASLIGLFDDSMTYISGNTNVQSAIKQLDTAIGSVSGANYWQRITGNLSPLTTSDTLSATSSAAIVATFTTTGTNDALRVGSSSNYIRVSSDGDLLPNADGTLNLGSSSLRWEELFVKGATIDIGDDGDSGLFGYNVASDYFSFDPDNDATAEFVMTDTGNFGVGTTAPTSTLHLEKTYTADGNQSAALIRPTFNFTDTNFSVVNGLEVNTISDDILEDGNDTQITGIYAPLQLQSGSDVRYAYGFNGGINSSQTSGAAENLDMRGIRGYAINSGNDTISNAYALDGYVRNGSTGTIPNATGLNLNLQQTNASGTITSLYGININNLSNSGTITNTYGAYIGDITSGTQTNTPFSFYASDANAFNYFAGNVGIGDTSPTYNLDVTGTGRFTSAVDLDGDLELNSTLTDINGAVGSAGQILSSTGTGVDWIDAPSGGSSAWDDITAPDANLTLAMSTYTTEFNWDTGTSTNDLFSLTTDASSNGTGSLLNIQTGASSTVSPLRVRAGSVESLFVNNAGNVGIGTSTAGSKLTVVGGNISIDNGSTSSLLDVNSVSSGAFRIGTIANRRVEFYANNAEVIRIAENGNLGIGTSSVDAKLDIVSTGTTQSTFALNIENSANSPLLSIKDGVGGLDENRMLMVVGNWTDGANYSNTYLPTYSAGFASNVAIGSDGTTNINSNTLDFFAGYYDNGQGGTTVPSGFVKARGTTPDNFSLNGALVLGAYDFPSTFDTLTPVEVMWVTSGGNVGIGTSGPSQTLDVNGTIRLRDQLYDENNSVGTPGQILSTTATGVDWIDAPSGSGSTAWDDVTDPSGNLALNMTTTNTTFNWDTGTSTNDLFSLTTDASSNGTGSLLNIQTGASSTVIPLRVRAGSTEALYVTTAGNVGVGTTSTGEKLEVNGSLRLNDGSDNQGVVFANGGTNRFRIHQGGTQLQFTSQSASVGQTFTFTGGTMDGTTGGHSDSLMNITGTWNQASDVLHGIKVNITDTNSAAASELIDLQLGGTTQFSVRKNGQGYFAGNVGIGSTAPTEVLDVNGNIRGNQFIDTTGGGSYFLDPAAGGTSLVVAGNIGIASLTPTFKLDVNGTFRASGTSQFDGDLTLGNATTDQIVFTGRVNSDILPISDGDYDLGSSALRWNALYVKGASIHIGDNGNDAVFGYSGTALTFDPDNDSTNEFVFTDDGNLGIGSTSPNQKLVVSGNASVTGSFSSGSHLRGNNVVIGGNDSGTFSGCNNYADIVCGSTHLWLGTNGGNIYFEDAVNANDQNISNVDNLQIDNNVGIGTTGTSTARLHVRGGVGTGAQIEDATSYGLRVTNLASNAIGIRLDTSGASGTGITVNSEGTAGEFTSSSGDAIVASGTWRGNDIEHDYTGALNGSPQSTTISSRGLIYDYHLAPVSQTNTTIVTFNNTGLQNTDGSFAIIRARISKPVGATGNTTMAFQIQSTSSVGFNNFTHSGGAGTSVVKNITLARSRGVWHPIGQNVTADNADLAEWFPYTGVTPKPGEIVAINPVTTIGVVRSEQNYQDGVVGVVTTAPHTVMGEVNDEATAVGLAGRVPVIVTTKNGQLKPGDYITSSNYAGTGMKARFAGQVVGKAMEGTDSWLACPAVADINSIAWPVDDGTNPAKPCFTLPNGDVVGKIMMLIDNSWYEGDIKFDEAGQIQIAQENGEYVVTEVGSGHSFKKIVAYSQAIVGQIRAGLINTKDLVVEQSATIANLSVESLQINGQSLADYIASIIDQQPQNIGQQSTINDQQIVDSLQMSNDLLEIVNNNDETIASIDQSGNATLSGSLTTPLAQIETLQTDSLTATNASISGTTSLGTLLADTATVDSLTVQDASIAGEITAASARLELLESRVAEFEHIKAQTASLMDATISGTLYANNIADFDQKVATAMKQPSLLATLVQQNTPNPTPPEQVIPPIEGAGYNATGAAELNKSLADLELDSEDVVLLPSAVFIDQYLKVNGIAYVTDQLGVGNSILIGNGMRIGDGTIAYEPSNNDAPLFKIQPSGRGVLELMAGLMVLTADGTVAINGNLAVTGDLEVGSTLLSDLLRPTDFGNPFQVQVAGVSSESADIKQSRFEIVNENRVPVATISAQGRAQFADGIGVGSENLGSGATLQSSQSSGRAILSAETLEVTINSSKITENSLIYITPVGSTNNTVMYVKAQTPENLSTPENEGSFIVGFDEVLDRDVTFNWWIVN